VAEAVGPLDPERVRANLVAAGERIAAACARVGRDPGEVELLAATKYVPSEQMGALAEAGIELVGENIPRDLVEKHERWGNRLRFDFIGHLQSRRTKDVVPRVRLLHSVESESVLRQLDRHAETGVRVLLEVNVAGEASKYGVAPEDLAGFLEVSAGYEKVVFGGLMTMPPLVARPDEARPHFVRLREIAESLNREWAPRHEFSVLSMGTSQDYEVAVEEGATLVRLGSVLYA
jgi:pyridoxal phosphate enzyme (YggS family)